MRKPRPARRSIPPIVAPTAIPATAPVERPSSASAACVVSVDESAESVDESAESVDEESAVVVALAVGVAPSGATELRLAVAVASDNVDVSGPSRVTLK